MALLESKPPKLGAPIPDFTLPDVQGKVHQLADYADKQVLVVMFICAHCPYVLAVEERFVALSRSYAHKDVQFLGICANDSTTHPADAPPRLAAHAEEKGYNFPYLVDESQEVARAFEAVCTPEFYVFDAERKLRYHGRLDDNWKDPSAVQHHELATAIDALLNGVRVPEKQYPSMGCSIKWKQ